MVAEALAPGPFECRHRPCPRAVGFITEVHRDAHERRVHGVTINDSPDAQLDTTVIECVQPECADREPFKSERARRVHYARGHIGVPYPFTPLTVAPAVARPVAVRQDLPMPEPDDDEVAEDTDGFMLSVFVSCADKSALDAWCFLNRTSPEDFVSEILADLLARAHEDENVARAIALQDAYAER